MQLALVLQIRQPDGVIARNVLAEEALGDECKCKRGRVKWIEELLHGKEVELGCGRKGTFLVETENKLPVRAE